MNESFQNTAKSPVQVIKQSLCQLSQAESKPLIRKEQKELSAPIGRQCRCDNPATNVPQLSQCDEKCQQASSISNAAYGNQALRVDAELFDSVTQLAERQAKQFGGRGLVVTRLFEGIDDGLSLYILDLVAEVRIGRDSRITVSG